LSDEGAASEPIRSERLDLVLLSPPLIAGIAIGEDAVIGAGSVVTRSIAPGVVTAGNPCRVISAP